MRSRNVGDDGLSARSMRAGWTYPVPSGMGFRCAMETGGRYLPEEDFETDPASLVALVVGIRATEEVSDLLHERGWDVRHCPGPGHIACPLLEEGECGIRERSDGAILFADASDLSDLSDAGALVMCAAYGGSPAVAVVSGDVTLLDPVEKLPVFRDDVAPEVIVDAMEAASDAAVEAANG